MHPLRCSLAILLPVFIGHSLLFPDEPKTLPADEVGKLLNQLADPRYVRREEATKKLILQGEAILDRVRARGKETSEYEVQIRTRQVIRGILKNYQQSKSTGMKFTLIDSGSFTMGSPPNERNRRGDEPAHDIEISEPFVMGIYEVTQEEYEKVTKKRPSWFSRTGEGKDKIPVTLPTTTFPVENVSWFDAISFCNELSRLDGFRPYYKIVDPVIKGDSITEAKVTIEGGTGYHLPTEAQWEFAARAGTRTPFHHGSRNQGREANLRPNPSTGYGDGPSFAPLNITITVGNYPANAWGLHDMSGNVGEWCWDWYDPNYYQNTPVRNPQGPKDGKQRCIRGGSWVVLEGSCRSASRFFATPDTVNSSTGFRVIRSP